MSPGDGSVGDSPDAISDPLRNVLQKRQRRRRRRRRRRTRRTRRKRRKRRRRIN